MPKIKSLCPIPGSKSRRRYDFIQPLPFQKFISEPFCGGAAKSLQTGLRPILGEINPSLREIALVPTDSKRASLYIHEYVKALAFMIEGIDKDTLFKYSKVKQSQKVLRASEPALAETLDIRWKILIDDLFLAIESGDPMPGTYSFCQRACFGNVMRMNPKGTHFNVTWHVNKLENAFRFNVGAWCDQLKEQQWNPKIYSTWQESIEAVEKPVDTWLFLDPPYVEADGDRKMSSAYPGHVVTGDGREETFALAVDSLELGMQKGFIHIHLCNYFSDRLSDAIVRLSEKYDYSFEMHKIGECSALGNSNGRIQNGNRRDLRPKPIECVWNFRCF